MVSWPLCVCLTHLSLQMVHGAGMRISHHHHHHYHHTFTDGADGAEERAMEVRAAVNSRVQHERGDKSGYADGELSWLGQLLGPTPRVNS